MVFLWVRALEYKEEAAVHIKVGITLAYHISNTLLTIGDLLKALHTLASPLPCLFLERSTEVNFVEAFEDCTPLHQKQQVLTTT